MKRHDRIGDRGLLDTDAHQLLPLRPTKSFLAFSVERLTKTSESFEASGILWQDGFSSILVDLLELLRYV